MGTMHMIIVLYLIETMKHWPFTLSVLKKEKQETRSSNPGSSFRHRWQRFSSNLASSISPVTGGDTTAEQPTTKMPLYDCMLLLKPHVKKEALMDLVARVGKHVHRKNGVLTDMKSFGTVQLGYGIKKLDGRYFQGQLMQMTMMTPPNFNDELHYLNKEDRLLRWLLVKHRDIKYGLEFLSEDDGKSELNRFRSNLYEDEDIDEDDDDDEEYENKEGESNETEQGKYHHVSYNFKEVKERTQGKCHWNCRLNEEA